MPESKRSESRIAQALRAAAAALPDAVLGIACAGTKLESTTFAVAKKSFLFLGSTEARLKLGASLASAEQWAKRPDAAVRVGASGWVTVRLDAPGAPDAATLRRWVEESYGLFAALSPKQRGSKAQKQK